MGIGSKQAETIAAIATPIGIGGIGVIRVSGSRAKEIVLKLFNRKNLINRRVTFGKIINPDTGKTIDEVIVCYMKQPKTYTGDDVVEISSHGSPLILNEILNLIIQGGARLAEKGEFTKRRFLRGKISLNQAEAVIDLISARGKAAHELAIRQMEGSVPRGIRDAKGKLIKIVAAIETQMDYPDEEIKGKDLTKQIEAIKRELSEVLEGARCGKTIKEGVKVVIAGQANVGKSSLLNALVEENKAIVTEIPGTTRDPVEETIIIRGVPFTLIDTAGIRKTKDKIEILGINRAKEQIGSADIVILVNDATSKELLPNTGIVVEGRATLRVINKVDKVKRHKTNGMIAVSAKTGLGIKRLKQKLWRCILGQKMVKEEGRVYLNNRQEECLLRAKEGLTSALRQVRSGSDNEIISEEVRGAIAALSEATGETVSEEIIGMIFQQFCLGK